MSPQWMAWNLFLAWIPAVLSMWLFRGAPRRGRLTWWLAVIAFVAFLPNAAYVLTDSIHLVPLVRQPPGAARFLLVVSVYAGFIFAGFQAYVLSILNVRAFLRDSTRARCAPPVILALHCLSAVGVYLGRVLRFNSWDLVQQLTHVMSVAASHLAHPRSMVLVALTFVVIVTVSEILAQLDRAVARRLLGFKAPEPPWS